MTAIWLFRRIGPGYYLAGRFSRSDMPFRDKLAYFNGPAYSRHILMLNNRLFHKTSQHKVIESAILNYFSVQAPESYGFFHAEVGQSRSGRPLRTAADLAEFLSDRGIGRFVMKPSEGFSGRFFIRR